MRKTLAILALAATALAAGPALAEEPKMTMIADASPCAGATRTPAALRPLSAAGNGAASFELGCLTFEGRGGLTLDHRAGLELFRLAAKQGDARGARLAGDIAMIGSAGDPPDFVEAARRYQQAIDLGDTQALVSLGALNQTGQGVPMDKAKALALYRRAADKGSTDGAYNLGMLYLNGPPEIRDKTQAKAWLTKAAEGGLPNAMYDLAVMLELGDGVAADKPAALRWFTKAAEAGMPEAMYALGLLYVNGGADAPLDNTAALQWFRKAAATGHADATYMVGVMYLTGRGVDEDRAQGLFYVRLAAKRGSKLAVDLLNENNLPLQ